ncbi:MAG: serine hydrolase domain-containing protein [Myxococcota bacterium]
MPIGRVRKVHVFPAAAVTRRSDLEVDPRDVGLKVDDVDAIWRRVEAFYATGLQPAMGLCIRHRGQVILDRAIGHIRGNTTDGVNHAELVQATPESRFSLFSASKVVVAMLIHLFDDRGLLHLDDAVAEYIPGFAKHGKQRITLRHVLTHRAGIPAVPMGNLDLDILTDPEAMLDIMCEAKPQTRAGRRLAYHAITGGFVLGEVLTRVTGKSVRQLVQEEFGEPLGLKGFNYGVLPPELDTVALNTFTGPDPNRAYQWLLERSFGVKVQEAVEISNDPRFITGVIPSANIYSSAEETCRFFELLLREGEWGGAQIFSPRTVRRAVVEQTYLELDTTLMMPVRYGMGFMLGGQRLSLYGDSTPRAFGHIGFTNVLVWADPQRDLSVAFLNNGKPFITLRLLKWLAISREISRRIPKL